MNKNDITVENNILKLNNKVQLVLVCLLKLTVTDIFGVLIGILYGLTIVPSIATLINLKNLIMIHIYLH